MKTISKFTFFSLVFAMFCLSTPTFATVESISSDAHWSTELKKQADFSHLPNEISSMNMETFLNLTPARYEEMTGKKLGFFKKMELKAAQKFLKHKMAKSGKGDIPQGLYIVLAIVGLAWIAIGVMDNWSGTTWIINLLLYFLFWLPGLIHALIVMKNYY